MMKIQWTDEKNRLSSTERKIDSLKTLLMVKYNFKHLDCVQFSAHSAEPVKNYYLMYVAA